MAEPNALVQHVHLRRLQSWSESSNHGAAKKRPKAIPEANETIGDVMIDLHTKPTPLALSRSSNFHPSSKASSSAMWARSKESPMDWRFDEPRTPSRIFAPLDARKRSHDEAASGSGSAAVPQGEFSFTAPLSPSHAGPEVDMVGQTPPQPAMRERCAGKAEEEDAQAPAAGGEETEAVDSVKIGNPSPRKARARQANGVRRVERSKRKDATGASASLSKLGETFNVNYYMSHPGEETKSSFPDPRQWDPERCLGVAQFLFNSSLLAGLLWLCYLVAQTIRKDVADKVAEYELEIMAEIAKCSQSFSLNRCGTDLSAPALASACAAWEKCAAKDPAVVGRARVTAETFAEILNGFVDAISWKSMIFSLASMAILVGATNSTLSFFRIRSRESRDRALAEAYPSAAAVNPWLHHHGKPSLGIPPHAAYAPPYAPYPHASPYAAAAYPYPHGAVAAAGALPADEDHARSTSRASSLSSSFLGGWRRGRSSPTSTPAKKRVCSSSLRNVGEVVGADEEE